MPLKPKTTLYGPNSRLGMVMRTGTSLRASADKQCPECSKEMLVWEWLSGLCEQCLEKYSDDYCKTASHCSCYLSDGEYSSRGWHFRTDERSGIPIAFQRCFKYWEAAGLQVTTHPEYGPGFGLMDRGVVDQRVREKQLKKDLVKGPARKPSQGSLV